MNNHPLDESAVLISPEFESSDESLAAGRRMLDLVSELGVPISIEKSVKLAPGSIHDHRFLIGIDTPDLTFEKLSTVCRQLQIPPQSLANLERDYPRADMVLFGFEGGLRGVTYKVYLQFWSELTKELSRGGRFTPRALFVARKWKIGGSAKVVTSNYVCYPVSNSTEVMRRVDAIYGDSPSTPCRELTGLLLEACAKRSDNQSVVYLEVEESEGIRRSFDINLYAAQLRLKELTAKLMVVADYFNVSKNKMLSVVESCRFHFGTYFCRKASQW